MGSGALGFRCRECARAAGWRRVADVELPPACGKADPRASRARLGKVRRRAQAEMARDRAAVPEDDARGAATRPAADGRVVPAVAGRAAGGARAVQVAEIPSSREETGRSTAVGAVPKPSPGKEARAGGEASARNRASRRHGGTARSAAGPRIAAACAIGSRQCFAAASAAGSWQRFTAAGTAGSWQYFAAAYAAGSWQRFAAATAGPRRHFAAAANPRAPSEVSRP